MRAIDSKADTIDDRTVLKLVAMPCVVAMYLIYSVTHPGADGVAFGTMMGLLGLLAGVQVGKVIESGSS